VGSCFAIGGAFRYFGEPRTVQLQATKSNPIPSGSLLLILTVLFSCRPANQASASAYLTSSETQGSVLVEAADCKGCKPAPRTFYLIGAEQLKRVRGASGLTYMGSDAEHHFFRAWNKLLEPPEIDHVAVPLAQCTVSEPHSLDEEHALLKDRKLDQAASGCVVH
jgi:hypothetical protein